jgi:hypothetical protein
MLPPPLRLQHQVRAQARKNHHQQQLRLPAKPGLSHRLSHASSYRLDAISRKTASIAGFAILGLHRCGAPNSSGLQSSMQRLAIPSRSATESFMLIALSILGSFLGENPDSAKRERAPTKAVPRRLEAAKEEVLA